MTATHWTIEAGRSIVTEHGNFRIVKGDAWTGRPTELDDAARLAAAAPELLAELRALVGILESAWGSKELTAPRYVQCQLGTQVKHATNAIARAEGRD